MTVVNFIYDWYDLMRTTFQDLFFFMICRGEGGEQLHKTGANHMDICGADLDAELHGEFGIVFDRTTFNAHVHGRARLDKEKSICGVSGGIFRERIPRETVKV